MFYVGQKVVFIGDYTELEAADWAVLLGIEFPKRGSIYTVRRLVQRPLAGDVAYGLLLHEVLNKPCLLDRAGLGGALPLDDPRLSAKPEEVAFNAADFRPLITVEDFVTADTRIPEPA